MKKTTSVPPALKNWFVLHFIVDLIFAIPLMVVPVYTLTLFQWTTIDPIVTRIIAAALFGIGIESFLMRNADIETYKKMIDLKIIWSCAVIFGLLLSIFTMDMFPFFGYIVLGIFIAFNILWLYWKKKLG